MSTTATFPINARATATCLDCLQSALLATPGIKQVNSNLQGTSLTILHDEQQLPPEQLQQILDSAQQSLTQQMQHEILTVSGIDCADCSVTLERGLNKLPGVVHVQVNFTTSLMTIGYIQKQYDQGRIARRVQELGYQLADSADAVSTSTSCSSSCCQTEEHTDHATTLITPSRAKPVQARPSIIVRTLQQLRDNAWLPTASAAVLWVIAFGLEQFVPATPELVVVLLYALAIIIGGYRIARNGYFALIRSRTLDINVLMTIAVTGAAILGEWGEGSAVVVLFALGETLEHFTMERVRRSISSLLDLSPREATRKSTTGEQRVPVSQLVPGDTIIIRPGERIAADGEIITGSSTVNQAPITGESLPVTREVGDTVFAGTINEHGALEVRVTRFAQDTTLARIIALVQQAQGSRAPFQRFIDRFARTYTPIVIVLALLVATLPPLILNQPFIDWIYKALVLLVIACPCALVISTPVSIVAAIGRASRLGILIKGGAYLEALGTLRAVAFDKTGTITKGRPTVTDLLPLTEQTPHEILGLAAAVESRSEHPLAHAILESAREQGITWQEPQDFKALPGQGAQATIYGETILVGKPALFASQLTPSTQQQIEQLQQAGKTVLLVGNQSRALGIMAVADQIRPEAAATIKRLKEAGITSTIMLTGDNEHTAQAVARQVGIDEVRANLLPEEKLQAVQQLDQQYKQVAMIGDGINDAPALAHATVGIAMGVTGNDTAMETADVALMTGDLRRLPAAIRLSRRTVKIIRANVIFALAIKALFLALTIAGITNLWLAILADTGTSLLVIANGMRLLSFHDEENV